MEKNLSLKTKQRNQFLRNKDPYMLTTIHVPPDLSDQVYDLLKVDIETSKLQTTRCREIVTNERSADVVVKLKKNLNDKTTLITYDENDIYLLNLSS